MIVLVVAPSAAALSKVATSLLRNLFRSLRTAPRREHGIEFDAVIADLALTEQSFRAAFDDSPGAVAMVAGRGEADGRLLRVNPAFARMLGRSVADLHLREITSITHPEDRDSEAVAAPDDATRTVRKRYLHASGRPVHVEVRLSGVRDAGGVVSYLLSHVVDLDAHEASQRALHDAARIRRDMVSTISHELRTPLTSVQGYLEMIAGEDFGTLTIEQKSMIDVAVRNAVRLEGFVADLVMLARLDAAEFDPIRHFPVDLVSVIGAAVADVAEAAEARKQELLVDLPGLPATVSGDAAHLKRAVQSLLTNAVKYTAHGGRITVSVGVTDDVARISVADTGMGIPAEDLPMLGDRFFRGTDAQRRAIGGTGLGLAIAKTIAARHGGTLDVDSTPGQGSTFTIVLPAGFSSGTGGAGGA